MADAPPKLRTSFTAEAFPDCTAENNIVGFA
jgi:hypothetical protein